MMTTPRTFGARALLAVAALLFAAACGSDEDAPTEPTPGKKTATIAAAAGSGRVTSSDGRIDCRIVNGAAAGPACSFAFDSAAVTVLTATPDADNEFVAWAGDCTGATCQLTLTRDLTASPRFAATQGVVTLELSTPNADDGAVLFTVTGPSILGVSAAPGLDLLESRTTVDGATTSTIIVRGNLANGGALAQLTVRGVHLDATYATQVREAAAGASGNYQQRGNISAYQVTAKR